MWERFFGWAAPALTYLKPWLLSFLAGLVLAVFQAVIALSDSDQPFKLSNLVTVLGGVVIVYVTTKVKHIQLKDLQAIIDGLIEALNGQQLPAQEPVSEAIKTEQEKG